jgi:hypothetical protein
MEKKKNSGSARVSGRNSEKVNGLIRINPTKLLFKGKFQSYEILGRLSFDVTDLTVMLVLNDEFNLKRHRRKVNLYNQNQVINVCLDFSSELETELWMIEYDISHLTNQLEKWRDSELQLVQKQSESREYVPVKFRKEALQILKDKSLINRISALLGNAGIAGEKINRLLLYLCAITYKNENPLHVIVKGSSGAGKSHLINTIGTCIPQSDLVSFTRVADKSLFHCPGDTLDKKLVLIQDFDGLEGKSLFALRELQSAGTVKSYITSRTIYGNHFSEQKTVQAMFASISASTKEELYTDNLSRSIVLHMDESNEQTKRIIDYQNLRSTGQVDLQKENESKVILRNLILLLKPKEIINPYADKIIFPAVTLNHRRMHLQFSTLVSHFTFIFQYQRKEDLFGRLISTKADMLAAVQLFSEVIFSKYETRDNLLNENYQRLKNYLGKRISESNLFTSTELKREFSLSKSQLFRFLENLKKQELISVAGGSANKGFIYRLKLVNAEYSESKELKQALLDQLKKIKEIKN